MIDSNFKLSNAITTQLSTAQTIGISGLEANKVNIKTDRKIKTLTKKLLDFTTIAKLKKTKNFYGDLRPYQQEGLSWLYFLFDYGLNGILADEMGLGKTVQTLSIIQYLKDTKKTAKKVQKPTLIVAPTSVITNWMYEARKFTPCLSYTSPSPRDKRQSRMPSSA